MRIGIDARFYGPDKGIGRYSQKLITNLEKIDRENEYIIFLCQENFDLYQPQNQNFKKVLAPWRWYSFAEQFFLPFKIYQQRLDFVHFLHYNVPFFYFGKFIVTIHDTILIYFPSRHKGFLNWLSYEFRNLFFKLILFKAIFKSNMIITDSDFTKNQLMKYFRKINSSKIKTIYLG